MPGMVLGTDRISSTPKCFPFLSLCIFFPFLCSLCLSIWPPTHALCHVLCRRTVLPLLKGTVNSAIDQSAVRVESFAETFTVDFYFFRRQPDPFFLNFVAYLYHTYTIPCFYISINPYCHYFNILFFLVPAAFFQVVMLSHRCVCYYSKNNTGHCQKWPARPIHFFSQGLEALPFKLISL